MRNCAAITTTSPDTNRCVLMSGEADINCMSNSVVGSVYYSADGQGLIYQLPEGLEPQIL